MWTASSVRSAGPARRAGAGAGAGERQRPSPSHAQVGVEVLGGTEADDPGAGGLGQRGRAGGVIEVGVRDQYRVERAPGLHGGQQRGQMTLVRRAGVDHRQFAGADQVAVRARPGHEPRVGRGQAHQAGRQLHRLPGDRDRPDAGVGHRPDHVLRRVGLHVARHAVTPVTPARPRRSARRRRRRLARPPGWPPSRYS